MTARRLPRHVAFVGTVSALFAIYLGAGAPTPLYVVYEETWGFPAWVLTIAFAIYAFGLIAALLVAGSLSDHIGRRPILIGALTLEVLSMALFLFAPDIGWVIIARLVQGFATGAATSAFTASVLELAPDNREKLGAMLSGAAPAGGLALGALASGFAVQFAAYPSVLVFVVLTVVMILGLIVVALSPETTPGRPGALRSLMPRLSVPAAARGEFVASIPVHVAAWMLAGLFLGLAPSIIRDVFHIHSGLLNGAAAFLEPGVAALVGLVIGRVSSRNTTLIGSIGVFLGVAIIVAGTLVGWLPLLFVGAAVGGLGFGASLSGALRTIAPLAGPAQRAELFAAVYLVAYLALGVPVIVAGLFIVPTGLLTVALVYGAVAMAVAVVGVIAQLRAARNESGAADGIDSPASCDAAQL